MSTRTIDAPNKQRGCNGLEVTGTGVGDKRGIDVSCIPTTMSWDDTSTANTIYVGHAEVGSLTSAAVWKIKRVDTANGRIEWADGDSDFDNIWDNRTGLSYS